MKKQLLSLFAVVAATVVTAQVPSPSWSTVQNAGFTVTSAGHRFLDAVDNNVVWLSGYDGFNAGFNYNWYSTTSNGGTNYTSGNIFSDTNSYSLGNMEGIDAMTAWVAAYSRSGAYSPANPGGGGVFMTQNGGATWTNMTGPNMFTNTATSFCNWVTFLDPNTGVVNGDPVNGEFELWRTTNGGASWTQVAAANIPNPSSSAEFAIVNLYCKQGTTNIWFGTNAGRVYRSFDAGVTWSVSTVAATGTITELAFTSQMDGVVLAANSASAGNVQLYRTNDGGATWTLTHNVSQAQAATANLGRNDLCDIPGTGYLASVDNQNGTLSYSKNNGVTWTNWNSQGIGYVCIDFANSYRGWAGSFSDATNPTLGGIFKFNGLDFNSNFTITPNICRTTGNVTVSPGNMSGGLAPVSFSWSAAPSGVQFSSSTASVPVITFSANGIYTITLDVTNPDGTATSTQTINILTCNTPVANFTVAATACNNVAITLTNTSTGSPAPSATVSVNPSSNVTVTPTGNNFTLKFANAGTYTVDLLASNISGTSSASQTITINDCVPVANFSLSSNLACRVVDTVYASNMSTGTGAAYTWTVSGSQSTWTLITNPSNPADRKIAFKAISSPTTGSSKYTVTLTATNPSGSSTKTDTIRVFNNKDWGNANCVGLSEVTNLGKILSVFPNPAHDMLTLTLPSTTETLKITLTNILGSVIYDERVVNKEKHAVSIANYPKGVYLLSVENAHEKVTRKIIVE
ncbi:MAG: T9SS type A sorting domain-containing protein [Bacteroidia bacterium]|nr:T9SS type A sorting domain-containing protein [Bacteroidia bacterium]